VYCVGSAGIQAKLQSIHPIVCARLLERGADPVGHIQRKLTQFLLDEADCVVAMGRDHQEAVQRLFGLSIPFFNQLCCDRDEPILDLHEVPPDWEGKGARTRGRGVSV